MKDVFDLTTTEGRRNVGLLLTPGWGLLGLIGHAAAKLFEGGSNEKDAEAARLLIIEGRKQGLKRMTIKMSRETGADLGASIEGLPLKVKAGGSGTVEVTVEYK